MRVLVMGSHKVANILATSMAQDGHEVTVLGTDGDHLEEISEDQPVDVLLSSGSIMEDFRDVDIDSMDVCLAASSDDNWNAMVAQVARSIFQVPKVICLVEEPDKEGFYRLLGIHTICPTIILSNIIKSAMVDAG
jgi:trk system potassium uptake protein TrkA